METNSSLSEDEFAPLYVQFPLSVFHAQHPPSGLPSEHVRELRTIAQTMDELLRGNVIQSMDILAQRFKSLVAATTDGNSGAAHYLELIPSNVCAAAGPEELELARRALSGDLKIKELVRKGGEEKK